MSQWKRGREEHNRSVIARLIISWCMYGYLHPNKHNIGVAWIDVRKAYVFVDHDWLKKTV